MFAQAAVWDKRYQDNPKHVDWLVKYETVIKVLPDLSCMPLGSALVIGSGISTFPEQIYDRGLKDVVVLELSKVAVDVINERNRGPRSRLRAMHLDVTSDWKLDHRPFTLALDKGTLDCVLSDPKGHATGPALIRRIWQHLATPATFILVSHAPPSDRLELIKTVYWHDIQVKVVEGSRIEELTSVPYSEELKDWSGNRALREAQQKLRGEGPAEAGAAEDRGDFIRDGGAGQQRPASAASHNSTAGASTKQVLQQSRTHGKGEGRGEVSSPEEGAQRKSQPQGVPNNISADGSSERGRVTGDSTAPCNDTREESGAAPEEGGDEAVALDDLGFEPGRAFIYILTK